MSLSGVDDPETSDTICVRCQAAECPLFVAVPLCKIMLLLLLLRPVPAILCSGYVANQIKKKA
jgi:hypothetical protein